MRCEVVVNGAPDLEVLDALARLHLEARRVGIALTFRVDGALGDLVTFVGLDEVLEIADDVTPSEVRRRAGID